MARYTESVETWTPRTSLGKKVLEGNITSINEVFNQGYKIRETGIVDFLLPNLKQEVLDISIVQKQTDAGEKTRFKALVVMGNFDGFIALGTGKSKQVREAIQKGVVNAKLNIFPVRRGCGSWECDCGESHSIPFKVLGKCGSVRIELIPGPRGLGIVAPSLVKTIISFSGIRDCWTKSHGSTKTTPSLTFATYNALKNIYHILTPKDWAG